MRLCAVSGGGRGMMDVFWEVGLAVFFFLFFCWTPILLRLRSGAVLCLLLGC